MERDHHGREPLELRWRHPAGLVGLSFKNLILTILTLGIYRFWAKTAVRRRLWQAVRVNGQPLEYTGTGKELFLGAIIAGLIIFVPTVAYVLALMFVFGPDSMMVDLLMIPLYVFFFFLVGVAVYRAMRYRLRRTLWRGIRGTMTGSPWRYGWTYFWTALTVPLTLGWSIPWRSVKLARLFTSDMSFGNRNFRFDGSWKALLGPFAVMWGGWLMVDLLIGGFGYGAWMASSLHPGGAAGKGVGMLAMASGAGALVMALVAVWLSLRYKAAEMNYLASRTGFEGLTFSFSATPGSLLRLWLGNLFIVLFSLGILSPLALARTGRYLVSRTRAEGTVDFSAIAPPADRLEGMGEGLADAFDIDGL